jgi:hypothetical protein
MASAKKASDGNPFVGTWTVSFAPLREEGESIGHPFGRTGRLEITALQNNEVSLCWDQDRSGQDFQFSGTWEGGLENATPSISASIEVGNRTYSWFGYLRQETRRRYILGHLKRLRSSGGPTDDSDADGSWIGGDDTPDVP